MQFYLFFCKIWENQDLNEKWFSLNQRETHVFFEDIISTFVFLLLQKVLLSQVFLLLLHCDNNHFNSIHLKQTTIFLVQLYKLNSGKLSHLSKHCLNILLHVSDINGYLRYFLTVGYSRSVWQDIPTTYSTELGAQCYSDLESHGSQQKRQRSATKRAPPPAPSPRFEFRSD